MITVNNSDLLALTKEIYIAPNDTTLTAAARIGTVVSAALLAPANSILSAQIWSGLAVTDFTFQRGPRAMFTVTQASQLFGVSVFGYVSGYICGSLIQESFRFFGLDPLLGFRFGSAACMAAFSSMYARTY